MTLRAVRFRFACVILVSVVSGTALGADPIPVDLSGYRPDSRIDVRHVGERLTVVWPVAENESGRLVLDLRSGRPLVESLGLVGKAEPILAGVDPVVFVTVGTRSAPKGRPPGMSPFNVFFDSPAKRPHQTHRSTFAPNRVRARQRS